MEKYIAFLRGINVGGKNRVSMPELKVILEQNGFSNVVTYINSGNIIFTSEETNQETLKIKFELVIKENLQLEIPVTIVSVKELSEALEHKPSWWNEDTNAKHNAIFVISPMTVEEVFSQVGATKPEYEQVDYYGSIIFWSAPLETFSITRWSKVVKSSAYNCITIRNANTVNKLIELSNRVY